MGEKWLQCLYGWFACWMWLFKTQHFGLWRGTTIVLVRSLWAVGLPGANSFLETSPVLQYCQSLQCLCDLVWFKRGLKWALVCPTCCSPVLS
jgi:hypothetical protein